ncbi:MAG: peptidoglycan-binding domain-containing protein, partial [Patescibacteria group bacterium]
MFRRLELLGFAILFIFISSFVLAQSVRAGSVFVFNKNLKTGNVGADVKELQKFLNNNGFFVNNSGLGSLGQETTFFGTATRNALIKFQKANKINPAVGYFGPVSRSVVNKNAESFVTAQTPLSNQVSDKQLVTQVNNQPDQSVQDITKKYFTVGGGITGITGAVILQNNGKDDLIIDIGDNSEFT